MEIQQASVNTPSTIHIVIQFMNDHFDRCPGLDWRFKDDDPLTETFYHLYMLNGDDGTRIHRLTNMTPEYRKTLLTVCRALTEISGQEVEFIKELADSKTFDRMTEATTIMLISKMNQTRLEYTRNGIPHKKLFEKFEKIGDELLKYKIDWEGIITFLLFSSEVALKIIKSSEETEHQEWMLQIIACVVKYIDERNILDWILKQPGGWLNILEHRRCKEEVAASSSSSSSEEAISSNLVEAMKLGCAIVAVFAVVTGFHLCFRLALKS